MKKEFKISPFAQQKGLLNIIIETPKGSRNKYAYHERSGLLTLRKVLPCGMVFPFDFGAIPSTRGDDGDPLDVLVLMEEPVNPPCMVEAHLIGVIEAEQSAKGKCERNDRLVAMASSDSKPAEIKSVKKLDPQILREIERFFVSYNELEGKKFEILRFAGPKTAVKRVKEGQKKYRKKLKESSDQ
jgi:inorganic pyrophosphatase